MNALLYPLKFRPLFKRYLWGGRRLGEVLGKPLGEGNDYAESWEIADHASGQSIVTNGSLAGRSLGELVAERGGELLGRHAAASSNEQPRFPLLFKFLDCHRDLSVQVHPPAPVAAIVLQCWYASAMKCRALTSRFSMSMLLSPPGT